MPATTSWAVGASTKSGVERATKYTPAVTIVAAWISALTGVGPSIASGNQTISGNWALLPIAPRNSNRQIAVTVAAGRAASLSGWPSVSANVSEPKLVQIRKMASTKPKSPMRLTTNAFLAAAAALGFWNQKPI